MLTVMIRDAHNNVLCSSLSLLTYRIRYACMYTCIHVYMCDYIYVGKFACDIERIFITTHFSTWLHYMAVVLSTYWSLSPRFVLPFSTSMWDSTHEFYS